MPRLRQPQTENSQASSITGEPAWKWKVIGFIIFLVVAAGFWSTGILQNMMAGPKIPLPREVAGFRLGMSLDEVMQHYPLMNLGDLFKEHPGKSLEEILKKDRKLTKKKLAAMEKSLRPFNGDPNFGIATIMPQAGLAGAGSADLLFYLPTKTLYFVSVMWDGADAQGQPVDQWAHDYRRWLKDPTKVTENLSPDVHLKEWRYKDHDTEMTVRDLSYTGHTQRWEDLRDATNEPAQSAFSQYRLEPGS